MKLVTFQTIDAMKKLINNGYLECDEKYIELEKLGTTYNWILEKMKASISNDTNAKYPIWCWVKFKNGIYPPKHKANLLKDLMLKLHLTNQKKMCYLPILEDIHFY